jgi:regulatory protein
VPRRPRSRASESSSPPDAFTTALVLLGQRELSEVQLRTRLARRGCDPDDIERTIERLRKDRTLDDTRVARAAARLESSIRKRGPARVRQRLHAMGLDRSTVDAAVKSAFEEVDEASLLDAALSRRLKGRELAELDEKARARMVRSLVGQGFALDAVLKRVKNRR